MKKLLYVILFFIVLPLYSYDYLESSTNSGTAVTPVDGSYDEVVSTTINVTGIDKVMLLAAMEMRRYNENTQGREVWFKISNDLDSNDSGEIYRQVQAIDSNDYGIGSLVHIFNTSSLSGDMIFTLEHKNTKTGTDRDVQTKGVLTAIVLETATGGVNLNSSNKRLDATGINTSSGTYTSISGLETDVVTLPIDGAIYVAASIDCKKISGDVTVGEWKLQYKQGVGGSWTDLGIPVPRTISINADDGIVSLVSVAENLSAGDYYFTVAHKVVSGDGEITTHSSNLVAVALAHSSGYFPHFYNEVTSDQSITDQSPFPSAFVNINSESITTAADIGVNEPDILVHAQLTCDASGLIAVNSERLISNYRLELSGTTSWEGIQFRRLMADNSDRGSGGLINLIENVNGGGLCSVALNHQLLDVTPFTAEVDYTLTSSNLIIAGFQLFDNNPDSPVPIVLSTFSATFMSGNASLNWSTFSETNNLGWNIYRGISNSADEAIKLNLGLVEGAGTTSEITEYIYIDDSWGELIELQSLKSGEQVWFWLESVSSAGETKLSNPVTLTILAENENPSPEFPENFRLLPNYPNPFNPKTTISFNLISDELVKLSIYNIKGRLIRTLFEGLAPGQPYIPHEYIWDGLDSAGMSVNSGIYFYKLESDNFISTRKMILLK